MATRSQTRLTYADLVAFPDDGHRWELLDGEAFVVPSPDVRHQDIVGRLYRLIADHLDAHGGGRVLIAPMDVLLSEDEADVVQPDVIFVSDAGQHVITAKNVRGVPTWVIEVVSDPVRDKKVKRDTYARFGVPEYWAVDPELRQVEVHRPRRQTVTIAPPTSATPSVLPGLTIALGTLFGPPGPTRI